MSAWAHLWFFKGMYVWYLCVEELANLVFLSSDTTSKPLNPINLNFCMCIIFVSLAIVLHFSGWIPPCWRMKTNVQLRNHNSDAHSKIGNKCEQIKTGHIHKPMQICGIKNYSRFGKLCKICDAKTLGWCWLYRFFDSNVLVLILQSLFFF